MVRALKTIGEADFEHRVRENQRVVYQIAYGVLGNERDAEDIAQDTFIRAHAKLAGLHDPHKFRAWVSQISRRLALNRRRSDARARRREEMASFGAVGAIDTATIGDDRAFVVAVQSEITRLPTKLRDVMILCAVAGLDHGEAANILGIPEGTVRSRLHNARKCLLRILSR